ncbi:midasin isoform X2 [Magnolia sinica]|uniref:midasin isoform X2 n=1 Tax=Magnolia sinica TaxID=86752 RepID=UPI002658CAA1|nr:midasin isoform X2 [Magnolia sinica]
MSFDGSFSCKSALERFLARCPNLQSNPRLLSEFQKGVTLTEEEVVHLLAEPFLHPDYTIPMLGCFRPLSQKIVDGAVALLSIVPDLKSNSDGIGVEISKDDINVIEFYIRRKRTLRLHELASLAFCRALDLAPLLFGSVLSYFSFAPPPFQRLLVTDSASQLSEKDLAYLLDAIRVSYRILLMEPKVFSELWDWSCFLDLVQQCANVEQHDDLEFIKNIQDIRWCGIQILSIILRMSDRATENFGLGAEKALLCFLRWEEYCQDVSLEKAGWYLEATELDKEEFLDGTINFRQDDCLQSFIDRSSVISPLDSNENESVRKNRRKATCDVKSVESPFFLTSAMKKSFEMVLLAVSQKWPILLHGPTGSGKTALINKLAQVSGNQVLFLHMDELTDSKTLIGSYTCTERPGEFRWQPGSLTQALMNGFWVVFEDIDKAPSEVQSILLPLLEGASSYVTSRGEAISVPEGFRLFATVSTSKHDFCHTAEGRISLGVLWRKVMVGNPSPKDLIHIINAWYPSLGPLAENLVGTFEKVNSFASFQLGGFQGHGSASVSVFSRFTLRDLLKWCKRIAGLGFSFSGIALSASECRSIYQEAVDIFAASSASSISRLSIMKEIAKMLCVPTSEAETLYPPNKPTIQNLLSEFLVGRITLPCTSASLRPQKRVFVDIRSSLYILERIACSVKYNEPVLLVGETGTGKTTFVQNLASRLGQPLTVLNMSQQSDVADLLGGYKPTDARMICFPLHKEFKDLFCKTFSSKDNDEFLRRLETYAMKKNWKKLLLAFQKSVDVVRKQACEPGGFGAKRKRPLGEEVIQGWESFYVRLDAARNQIGDSACMSFAFVEGAFVTALRNGQWILLDEVNLAPPETLQRIVGVLEGDRGTLCLAERGDVDYIARHPRFRIFACMNPATDAGKRDLPYSLRSRFTEYFVDDVLDKEELILFIGRFVEGVNRDTLERIVDFYLKAKKESEEKLQDGANQKPQFSLRSLARALEYTMKARHKFGFQRALYDGFCMFFLTSLDRPSAKCMNDTILRHLLGGNMPPEISFDGYFTVKEKSEDVPECDSFLENYVLTKSIKEHLRNLARAVFIKRYPVLLQGPTSSGKTSLVQYLAAITGHEFVRINNHEHTDLQEYLGSYITDSFGKLVFHEGVLVKAVRNGYWIVLDELNLAPSDVLEALNRLLDDNRELFLPELQETLTAHPDFMLFATQNPPSLYGGRKMLSRAFRNRFLEIHVDEIPEDELSTILEQRCKIPKSYAMKMVDVMKDLQLHRQSSKVFAGKHGFITPRDLFRWADRFRVFGNSYEDLAKDGYFLLAERLRDESEKNVVQEVLEKRLRVKLNTEDLYKQESMETDAVDLHKHSRDLESLGNIVWTRSICRLYYLVERCYKLREPVLLVGETGGGKTTICQLLSIVMHSRLHILNCHMYTETSDFIGGFYPVRDRSRLAMEFKYHVEKLMNSGVFLHFSRETTISSDIENASSALEELNTIINSYRQVSTSHPDVSREDIDAFEQVLIDLMQLHRRWQTLFLWQDGPLIQAMKDGDLFLVDEISLADDSVLERLNSVLEPQRKLSLAEKGGSVLEKITAHPNFFLLATMNPGGDYGKKELSPALRNRFTEIWVPSVTDLNELRSIAAERFVKYELSCIADHMLKFWQWFNQLQAGRMLTVRDLLSWVAFINSTERSLGSESAFIHGAFLVLLDGLSLGTGISKHDAKRLRQRSLSFLLELLQEKGTFNFVDSQLSDMENYGWGDIGNTENSFFIDNGQSDHLFGINPFYIAKGYKECKHEGFEFFAPTTCRNALRVLRALQLSKPVLLEGSPGVGKTSLVLALGNFSGNTVVRINLSEQTDIMDLLGSDLPVEGDKGMKFAWSDGILLQALKNGSWVLLDELNLAPQSVLEGLNAILDHRAEVYVPELGLTFKCPPSFRVFACQNPSCQGGGRKGLPKSFLNRFTKVYVDELVEDDHLFICSSLYPSIPRSLLSKLICFNSRIHEDTMLFRKFGLDGSPWEFNLRDVIRSCQIMERAPEKSKVDCFLSIVYLQRMRTLADRKEVLKLYEEVFGVKSFINNYPRVQINPKYLVVGSAFVERNHFQPSKIFKSQLIVFPGISHSLEAALQCVQHQWLCILVGPSSSGKTSLIRLLAQLTGNALTELNLSSGTDISELLGCFEQYSTFRNCHAIIAQVQCYIDEYCSLRLESSPEALISERKDLIAKWLAFMSSTNHTSYSGFDSKFAEHWKSESGYFLGPLVEIIEMLKLDLEKYHLPVSWSEKDLNKCLKKILELQENNRMQSFSPKFEWVSGGLIKAIERGEWIVLENANLCNPTVLDRINSLVEPSGAITVNECGLVDGKPVVLHAHPKFRMFLTVNPRDGEISRAMRNRGVEIYMMEPYSLLDSASCFDCTEVEARDLKRFLVLSGIPVYGLVDAMAQAHMYARDAGSHLGICISLLELTRWVHLFQQLLMNGNMPRWSLHLSWEHTYLSSLGELVGRDIVKHVKLSYLSGIELPNSDIQSGCSLSRPGGWPAPMKLRNFLSYSKESCIKQNCMYLEFLGAQCAAYKLNILVNKSLLVPVGSVISDGHSGAFLNDCMKLQPSVIPVQIIRQTLFPNAFKEHGINNMGLAKFDLELTNRMLFFAANWTIEQATESNLMSHALWFKWYSSHLQPYCCFFNSFLAILEKERNHPIWSCIVHCWREITAHLQINVDAQPLPLLSLELVELAASNDALETSRKHLFNAIHSVSLLRLSFQQWNTEDEYSDSKTIVHSWALPFLKALRQLEEEVLNAIVESPCFDLLVQLYTDLLERHTSFWKGVTSAQFDCLLISWRSLKKDVIKLRSIFPVTVDAFLVESRNLDAVSSQNFNSPKSMLWAYGGHPFLPSSADVYSKMQQLLGFCDSIWPTTLKSWKQFWSGNDCLVKAVASANTELRRLAVEGVCMSSYISIRGGQEDADIVCQLEEIHQMLVERFEYERQHLEGASEKTDENSASFCCAFCPELLCRKAGFDSWLETLPLLDNKSFSLDMDLLQELSESVLVDTKDLCLVLSNKYEHLKYSLRFSLDFSSRPPTDFLPHQKILWTLDAWTSVDSVSTKVASSVLEMWYKWHSSLWTYCPKSLKSISLVHHDEIRPPCILFQPTKTTTLHQILQDTFPIKDYYVHCLKLRVASGKLWQDAPSRRNLSSTLFSAAHSLFQQIIYAHKKSFEENIFGEMKSIFCSIRENSIEEETLQTLKSLIKSSSHAGLYSSVESFVEPLLRELYFRVPSYDVLSSLGKAWLYIGGLRFHLLLNPDDPDPAMKYAFKYSQLLEKISLLELEIKVRQECDHLAGRNYARDNLQQRKCSLEKLEMERKRLKKKVVFRPDHDNFNKLKSECADFLKWAIKLELGDMNLMTDQVCNWQETSTCFINRLAEEYTPYIDIVQPIQVAVYEMKLGLSLIMSGAAQKAYLNKAKEDNIDRILETLYSFMQFPRGCVVEAPSIEPNSLQPIFPTPDLDASENILGMDMNLLKKLLSILRDIGPDKSVSILQLHATLYHIILVRVAHCVCESLLLDNSSFLLLNKIFDQFASLWINTKIQIKAKDDDEAQLYKFRPRTFRVEDILEVDVSALRELAPDESLSSEWQEMLVEQEFSEVNVPANERENLEEEWNLIQESVLKSMVDVHTLLFRSNNPVERVTSEDKLHSFVDSYKFGAMMMKDMEALSLSTLDANLTPEHLLYVCLEYKQKFTPFQQSSHVYNFYKDSNAPELSKVIKPLTTLQEKAKSFLNEWPDHPGLQKILDVAQMLLGLPVDTPLAKALLGLQFLLSRAQALHENDSRFSFSDQLQPIFDVVSSWQNLELESWPALLDGVLEQYEFNAGKLWFPLHLVLHRQPSGNIVHDNLSTIQSLEEFVQTASVGEFKKRLELLVAFHGQLNTSICLKANSSMHLLENLKILYNVFGYYIQFLPLISEHITASRQSVEKDLKDVLKLSQWELHRCNLSIESSKRTRQKLRKLIQKFNDMLQQPVMILLNQEMQKIIKVPTLLVTKLSDDIHDMNVELLPNANGLPQFSDAERSVWYDDWRKKIDSALQNPCFGRTSEFDFPFACIFRDHKEMVNIIRQLLSSACARQMYQDGWVLLENICRIATECAHLWKPEIKNLKKRRALADLLKVLERCGLHKSLISEGEFNSSSSGWFLQPAYDVQHLLLPQNAVATRSSHLCELTNEKCDSNWEIANQYYYKSMAMVQQLRQIHLNFHKDLGLEQANRSASFLNHLIVILRDQRFVAYGFAEQLKKLRKHAYSLKELDQGSDRKCSVTPNQHATHKCMWLQKQLFDSLCSLSKDTSLLLKTVENTHLNTCNSVKAEVNKIIVFLDKFISRFQKSKDLLDQHLLGSTGVITTPVACMPLFVVSEQMEQLVIQNFKVINDFEEDLQTFCLKAYNERSAEEPLLGHFRGIIERGKVIMEGFHSELEHAKQSGSLCEEGASSAENFGKLDVSFSEPYEETIKQIVDAFKKLGLLNKSITPDEDPLSVKITSWKVVFESHIKALHLDLIYDALSRTVIAAGKLVNNGGHKQPKLCSQVQTYLMHLDALLDTVLTFGDGLMFELLAIHKTVAEMTYMLACMFTSIFSKGYGTAEGKVDDASGNMPQDATGTGMGEGEGVNDVSDQIDDEDQLLGTSEKSEGLDTSDEAPGKDGKGIEMEQDFAADTFSVSEDSGDDDSEEDDEDLNLDSVMGESSNGKEIVDEKLWDKEEDGNPDNTSEKYESGPSVEEKDSSSRELRAKEDNATAPNESGDLNNEESNRQSDGDENPDVGNDDEKPSDMKMDKELAFEDPSGIQLNEKDQDFEENMNMDEPEGSDNMEEAESEPDGTAEDRGDEDGKTNPTDDIVDEQCSGQSDGDVVNDEAVKEQAENTDINLVENELIEPGKSDPTDDPILSGDSTQPINDASAADASMAPERHWSNSSDPRNGLAPSKGLSNDVPEMEITVPNSSKGGKLTVDGPKAQSPCDDTLSVQRNHSNPFRSIGDALEEWKERIKITADSQEHDMQASDDMEDENADEYQFVSELEKGTSQALGPATSDQIDRNIKGDKPNVDEDNKEQREYLDEMAVEKEDSELCHSSKASASTQRQKMNEQVQERALTDDAPVEEVEVDNHPSNQSGNLVLIKNYVDEKILQLSNLTMNDQEFGRIKNIEDVSADMEDWATALWRRYELTTTRLSQELAEQLRLVMEPTQASKLQGDYRTGKRINMKKVIPYIASHYRKDKIWLRRTRPNKRAYQVVVAVDDSRSMSESRCGDVAVEALVTVCRAMSQLEVGQLAAVSFGAQGNVRLLHDFDQPFTGEAGIKMISSLTFKQDNTIADEPMVNLLKELNKMLDTAVANARLPTGQNPLQQLVLIIADGRFHEKENLKRCVRDVLTRKRMVAFLLLDSPQESIMDLMEASFQGETLTFSKYLNSFPFPYYIVLKNIEALPRTLSDLLRQWFELMQNTGE